MKPQRGAAMVEFAIIALLFFMILFGIIEFGRAFFTYNTLVEATRRGARVAAVCPAHAAGILQVQQTTFFDATRTQTTGMFGLTTANIDVSYLHRKSDGTMLTVPSPITSLSDTYTYTDNGKNITLLSYDAIDFVRVQLQNVNAINLIIPGISLSIPVPPIVTTLPSESLGRVSSENPVTQRCCYGYDACTTA